MKRACVCGFSAVRLWCMCGVCISVQGICDSVCGGEIPVLYRWCGVWVVSGLCDGYFLYVMCFGYVPCKLGMSFIHGVCVQ